MAHASGPSERESEARRCQVTINERKQTETCGKGEARPLHCGPGASRPKRSREGQARGRGLFHRRRHRASVTSRGKSLSPASGYATCRSFALMLQARSSSIVIWVPCLDTAIPGALLICCALRLVELGPCISNSGILQGI